MDHERVHEPAERLSPTSIDLAAGLRRYRYPALRDPLDLFLVDPLQGVDNFLADELDRKWLAGSRVRPSCLCRLAKLVKDIGNEFAHCSSAPVPAGFKNDASEVRFPAVYDPSRSRVPNDDTALVPMGLAHRDGSREVSGRGSEQLIDLPQLQLGQSICRGVEGVTRSLVPTVGALRVRVDAVGNELATLRDKVDVPAVEINAA